MSRSWRNISEEWKDVLEDVSSMQKRVLNIVRFEGMAFILA